MLDPFVPPLQIYLSSFSEFPDVAVLLRLIEINFPYVYRVLQNSQHKAGHGPEHSKGGGSRYREVL